MGTGSLSPFFGHYVAEVIERADALGVLAKTIEDGDFISSDPPAMIRMIGRLSEVLKPVAVARWQKYQRTGADKDYAFLRGIDAALRQLAGDLRLPERATSDRVPGTLTRLVSAKLRLINPQCGLILRPQWNYNYKVHREDISAKYRRLLKPLLKDEAAVDKALEGIPKPLFIISFPILERRSIHLHSVLGHEIGHIMARQFLDPGRERAEFETFVRRLSASGRTLIQEASTGASGRSGPVKTSPAQSVAVEEASEARRIAIGEYAADAAGVLLFGVSAVLGAADVAVSRGFHAQTGEAPRKYPTWGDRLDAMLEFAEGEGALAFPKSVSGGMSRREFEKATKAVQERLAQIRRWISNEGRQGVLTSPWITQGHRAARALLPKIRVVLRESFDPALFCDPAKTYARLPLLFRRLELGVPPDNVSASDLKHESPALEDIFAASWWWRLHRVRPSFADGDLEPEAREQAERLRRLTLKAIEDVQFLAGYGPRIGRGRAKRE